LAPKVSLFADTWAKDPEAEFFGGTSRDFLYWVKGQFKDITTREDTVKKMASLRALKILDVRDFIIGESDVDVITSSGTLDLDAGDYGVRKIDPVDRQRLDPSTEMGKTEREQGHIPMEKIRLGRNGLIDWRDFGDGIGELHSGKPTVHFAPDEVFRQTTTQSSGRTSPFFSLSVFFASSR
jgi:hypothetical protein